MLSQRKNFGKSVKMIDKSINQKIKQYENIGPVPVPKLPFPDSRLSMVSKAVLGIWIRIIFRRWIQVRIRVKSWIRI
jgi:hypothetical protein